MKNLCLPADADMASTVRLITELTMLEMITIFLINTCVCIRRRRRSIADLIGLFLYRSPGKKAIIDKIMQSSQKETTVTEFAYIKV